MPYATLTVVVPTSGPYEDGDCVGGLIALTDLVPAPGRSVSFLGLCVRDRNSDAPDYGLKIGILKGEPVGEYEDGEALVLEDDDKSLVGPSVLIEAADFMNFGGLGITTFGGIFSGINAEAGETTPHLLLQADGEPELPEGSLEIDLFYEV